MLENLDEADDDGAQVAAQVAGTDDDHAILAQSPADWVLVLRAPLGAAEPWNVPQAELLAVASWLANLEDDLAQPATARDHWLLGAVGRHALLAMRLARSCFRSSARNRGEPRPNVAELRQSTRLIADLLARLQFRTGLHTAPPDIRESWGEGDST